MGFEDESGPDWVGDTTVTAQGDNPEQPDAETAGSGAKFTANEPVGAGGGPGQYG